jgi:hypothetical protein
LRIGSWTQHWFTFAGIGTTEDRDVTSYGVVRMLDETRWVPKKVFHTVAARYARG